MSKPIRIELEFHGWQRATVTSEDEVQRPPTAKEMTNIIVSDIQRRFEESVGAGKLKVKVRAL